MPQIFDGIANENARYKCNELEFVFMIFRWCRDFVIELGQISSFSLYVLYHVSIKIAGISYGKILAT